MKSFQEWYDSQPHKPQIPEQYLPTLRSWARCAWDDGQADFLNGLHMLIGNVEDRSDTTLHISHAEDAQDYIVSLGNAQPPNFWGGTIKQALEKAIDYCTRGQK